MIEIFDTQQEYNVYTSYNTCLQSDRLYYIKENGDTHFFTNNIDGEAKVYNKGNIPEGNITITENGNNIDVFSYATASVAVPLPEGNITITENGNNFDVFSYATATVNVPDLYEDVLINLIERDITSIDIPADTTTIGNSAFINCTSLTSVTIPNSVTTIGNFAFQRSNISSVTIPNSVTFIGSGAFASCTNLNTMIIGTGITSIPSSFVELSSHLTNVIIPNNVTSIGARAFYNCSALASVTVEATTPPTLGSEVFSGVSNSFNIYVPAGSVDTYKAAAGWSTYADKIQAIP